MSIKKQLSNIESKLDDFIEVMQRTFFNLEREIDTRFEAMEEKFDTRFEAIDEKFTARFDDMDGRFDALTNEVRNTQRKQGILELQHEDVADTVMNHEERITRFELAGA